MRRFTEFVKWSADSQNLLSEAVTSTCLPLFKPLSFWESPKVYFDGHGCTIACRHKFSEGALSWWRERYVWSGSLSYLALGVEGTRRIYVGEILIDTLEASKKAWIFWFCLISCMILKEDTFVEKVYFCLWLGSCASMLTWWQQGGTRSCQSAVPA